MSHGITNGNMAGAYIVSASITPAQVAGAVTVEQSFTVTINLKVGDLVLTIPPSVTAGTSVTATRVTAANTISITFSNPTAGPLTPAAGTYTFIVFRPVRGFNHHHRLGVFMVKLIRNGVEKLWPEDSVKRLERRGWVRVEAVKEPKPEINKPNSVKHQ
jgi:hypothetical protein